MTQLPPCPRCKLEYTYEDGSLLVFPECAHEWSNDTAATNAEETLVVSASNGNQLNEEDYVTVIKNLKIKGSSSVVKVGTKVKIHRLAEGDHDIDCKIEGIGAMMWISSNPI